MSIAKDTTVAMLLTHGGSARLETVTIAMTAMTTDPNAEYKQGFHELTQQLGHIPTTKDAGWWELQNQYSRSWAPAEEIAPTDQPKVFVIDNEGPTILMSGGTSRRPAWGPGSTGFSRKPAPQARAIGAVHAREGEALSGPEKYAEGEEAATAPGKVAVKPGAAEGAQEGARGPGGGVMAQCVTCGQTWERPKQRGRPNFKCEECRK